MLAAFMGGKDNGVQIILVQTRENQACLSSYSECSRKSRPRSGINKRTDKAASKCVNITSKSNFKKKTGTVALCVNNQCVLELLAKRVSAFLADSFS